MVSFCLCGVYSVFIPGYWKPKLKPLYHIYIMIISKELIQLINVPSWPDWHSTSPSIWSSRLNDCVQSWHHPLLNATLHWICSMVIVGGPLSIGFPPILATFPQYGGKTQHYTSMMSSWCHNCFMMSFPPKNCIKTLNALKSIHKCTRCWRDNTIRLFLHRPQVGIINIF